VKVGRSWPCGGWARDALSAPSGHSSWFPRTVRKIPYSSNSSLVHTSSWFDRLNSWLLVARSLLDNPWATHRQFASVRLSVVNHRTVHFLRYVTGGSVCNFGRFVLSSRMVCLRLCRLPKSFCSWVVLPLGFELWLIPRVGRSIVTTWPWQDHVGTIGCDVLT
jgi:hypothetical protein